MGKFLILYRSTVPSRELMAKATLEEMKEGMEAWMAWKEQSGDAIVEFGAPLGDGAQVTPEAVSATDGHVTGYSIIQADSKDAAVELLKSTPICTCLVARSRCSSSCRRPAARRRQRVRLTRRNSSWWPLTTRSRISPTPAT